MSARPLSSQNILLREYLRYVLAKAQRRQLLITKQFHFPHQDSIIGHDYTSLLLIPALFTSLMFLPHYRDFLPQKLCSSLRCPHEQLHHLVSLYSNVNFSMRLTLVRLSTMCVPSSFQNRSSMRAGIFVSFVH